MIEMLLVFKLAEQQVSFQSSGKNIGMGCHSFSRGPPDPGIEPISPVSPGLQADSLPAELLGKQSEIETIKSNGRMMC